VATDGVDRATKVFDGTRAGEAARRDRPWRPASRQLVVGTPAGRGVRDLRQLAEEFGISKTPIREAIFQLKNEGLVSVLPQRAASVFTLSAAEVIDLCEFRLVVESAALKMAMERSQDELVDALSDIVESMRDARSRSDVRTYLTLDTDFHTAFFEYCGNHHLRTTYDRFAGKIAALRTHLATRPMHTSLSFDEHVAIVGAVGGQNLDHAQEVLGAHIGRTRETYSEGIRDIATADCQ
jgi:DNA-binding GntR family transcriptional regulator